MTQELFDEIHRLKAEGFSRRAISRQLGVHRRRVAKALNSSTPPKRRMPPRKSIIDPHRGFLMGKLQQYPDLSAARLHAMLKEQGFAGSYSLVKEAVADLRPRLKPAYETLHFEPGECAQVDWGVWQNAEVTNGKRRLSVFVMVLCDSRMIYAELFYGESMEFWLAAHRNAFEYFGGVPKRVMVDNCKTAVTKVRRHGVPAQINADYAAFARHYGFAVDACNPYRPNEKGRVEHAVGYLRKSFLAGREPSSPDVLNPALKQWLKTTANCRVHGTTGQRPDAAFAEREQAALLRLPGIPHACAVERKCRVNSCCRVTVDVNRYSVPPQYASRRLLLHLHAERVVVRTPEGELIVDHPRNFGRNQEIVDPAHAKALKQLNGKTRENREVSAFLCLGEAAADYLAGLREKRPDAASQIRKINALAEIHGRDAVARALVDAREHHAYSSDYVLNLLDARKRFAQPCQSPVHVARNADLLELETPKTDLSQYDGETQS